MPRAPLRLVSAPDSAPLPGRARPRIGDILRAHGLATDGEIAAALTLHDQGDMRLGEALHAMGVLRPEGLVEALEAQWSARPIDPDRAPPDPDLIDRFSPTRCLKERVLPWRRIGASTVIAMENPDQFGQKRPELEQLFGPVMLALLPPGGGDQALMRSHAPQLRQRAESRVPSQFSCRIWSGRPLGWICAALCLSILAGLFLAPNIVLLGLYGIASLSLCAVTGLKLAAALAPDVDPESIPPPDRPEIVPLHPPQGAPLPVVSLLIPLYREERIASHLIRRMSRLDYPKALLDLCLVVEETDMITRATLDRTRLPHWMRILTVPKGSVKTKPRALNFALDFCRGSIVGVYDAEDAPTPNQIRKIVARFARADADLACLQGRLDFYNSRHNWLSRCFTLEYASWFRMLLPGLARLGMVVPLGGTTLFFRRELLENLGGWDAHNVTEDADLGLRLARAGYRTELIETVTREEANCEAIPWIKQRSRWLKGYAMTYAVHMRAPRQLWRDLGPKGFLSVQVLFLGTLVQFTLAPLLWSLWLLLLSLPHPLAGALPGGVLWGLTGLFLLCEAVGLTITAFAARRAGRAYLIPWCLTLPIYFLLASAALYKGLWEMIKRPFYWDKTEHGRFGGA